MTDQLGTTPDEVVDSLSVAIDEDEFDARTAEIATRFTTNPDDHDEELEYLAEEELTVEEFADAIETAPVPRMWGYPAADWATVDRVRELRVEGELPRREAEIEALSERDYGVEHIAELTRLDEEEVRSFTGADDG